MSIPEKYRVYEPEGAWFFTDHRPTGPAGSTLWPEGGINDYTNWLTDPQYQADYDRRYVEMGNVNASFMSNPVYLFGLAGLDPLGIPVPYQNTCNAIYIDFGDDPSFIPTHGFLFWQDSANPNTMPWDLRPMKLINDWLRVEFTSADIVDGKMIIDLPAAIEFRNWFTLAVEEVATDNHLYRVKEIKFLVDTPRATVGNSKDFSPPHSKKF